MDQRLLIVDDEPSVARILQPVLGATGWRVFSAASAVEALRLAKDQPVEVILLDLGLPDADGKDLIMHLKRLGQTAIIVISARHQEVEKVAALDAGADDYVDKPFSIDELMARIRAAQRRVSPAARRTVVRTGELMIDLEKRSVALFGEQIRFSPKEFDLLRTLAEHAGRVVTHRRLLLAGWGDPETDQQYLRSYIALLRQKLEEDPAEPRLLLSEPGVGYRLSAN